MSICKRKVRAVLALEDGTVYEGYACGAEGTAFGEVCFNTSMVGYQEIITDPSYAGQIVTMTYPQIGNYGVNACDDEREEIAARGMIVRDMCFTPSNFRSEGSFPEYLKSHGVVAIEGVDTRHLVSHIREKGEMRGGISTECLDSTELVERVKASPMMEGLNLVREVSVSQSVQFDPDKYPRPSFAGSLRRAHELLHSAEQRFEVVAYDFGAKRSILQGLCDVGCSVRVVPWDTPAQAVLDLDPDGVFLSNGPGDPAAVTEAVEATRGLLGKIPMFGICLGHQLINLAAGGKTYKLKFGHHGGNQPVMNLTSGCVEITAQNHGFNILPSALGPLLPEYSQVQTNDMREWVSAGVAPVRDNPGFGRVMLTHVNLNDGTAEGQAFLDIPAFSVQHHPEAHPGPDDSRYLFEAFARLMEGREDYLNVDLRSDRLGFSGAS